MWIGLNRQWLYPRSLWRRLALEVNALAFDVVSVTVFTIGCGAIAIMTVLTATMNSNVLMFRECLLYLSCINIFVEMMFKILWVSHSLLLFLERLSAGSEVKLHCSWTL